MRTLRAWYQVGSELCRLCQDLQDPNFPPELWDVPGRADLHGKPQGHQQENWEGFCALLSLISISVVHTGLATLPFQSLLLLLPP